MKMRKILWMAWALALAAATVAWWKLRAENAQLETKAQQSAAAAQARTGELEDLLRRAPKQAEDDRPWARACLKFCQELTPDQVVKALATTEKAGDQETRAWMRLHLLEQWAQTNGPAAMSYAQAHGGVLQPPLLTWAQRDPAAATAWARAQPPGPERDELLTVALFWLAGKDPEAALALTQEIAVTQDESGTFATPHTRSDAVQEVFYRWMLLNPTAAEAQAEQMPAGWQREAAEAGITNSGGGADPAGTLAWANTMMATKEFKYDFSAVISGVLGRWAQNDPAGAMNTVAQLPDGEVKQMNQRAVIDEWRQSDPAAVLAYMQGLPEGAEHTEMLNEMMAHWAAQDPAAAAEYLGTLPEGKTRDSATQQYIEAMALKDPAAAAKLALTLPPGKQDEVLQNAAMDWVGGNDPFNSGDDRGQGANMEDAVRWLQQAPAGDMRDQAANYLIPQITPDYPMLAAPLAEGLTNEKSRNEAIELVAASWLKLNRAEAATWLAATDLPVERKQKLLGK